METPQAPERGASRSLYGDGNGSINRRAILIGAAPFASVPTRASGAANPVARARTAMGGAALLARVRAIGWSGTARISTAAGVIDLGVDTRVEPFVRARCETWLVADGRPSMRTLMIEGHDGFSVNEGRQLPLSPRHAEHERQQFGIYGHMLLAGIATVQGSKIAAARPGLPAALFAVGHDGMLASADYIVDGPDSAATIREHFTFSGMVTDKGLLWPRRIAITRNGTPFFALTIDELAVELSPA